MKKFVSIVLALCMVLTVCQTVVFAKDELGMIEDTRKAIKNNADSIEVVNDMTVDQFLKAVKKVVPYDEVELSIPKEADYRIWNATSEKDGSIFANITITCDVYKRQEMYDFKIPQLTGVAAEINADRETLDEDVKAVAARVKTMPVYNDTTEQEVMDDLKTYIKNGSTIEWVGDFDLVQSTRTDLGSLKGKVRLTFGSFSDEITVNKLIRRDLPENQRKSNDDETTAPDDTKSEDNKPAEPEKKDDIAPVNFTDVADGAYYADAVKWAVEKKITAGTSATTFSPDDTCTRAQIITFLWRAAGSPVVGGENPYTDVSESDYYYNAALWCALNGMVDGTKFEANTPCTRSATVLYMWLSHDAPDTKTTDKFTDVSEFSDYAEAVAWAVENGVTSGTSDTTFSPDAICSRGQIVTLIKRDADR